MVKEAGVAKGNWGGEGKLGVAMDDDDRPVLIYTTFSSQDDATRLGETLVAARLAACVNMFPGMVSIFQWNSALEMADEVAMIIKTREGLKEQVMAETKRLHPYDVPALLVLSTDGGSPEYCAWISAETGGGKA